MTWKQKLSLFKGRRKLRANRLRPKRMEKFKHFLVLKMFVLLLVPGILAILLFGEISTWSYLLLLGIESIPVSLYYTGWI